MTGAAWRRAADDVARTLEVGREDHQTLGDTFDSYICHACTTGSVRKTKSSGKAAGGKGIGANCGSPIYGTLGTPITSNLIEAI